MVGVVILSQGTRLSRMRMVQADSFKGVITLIQCYKQDILLIPRTGGPVRVVPRSMRGIATTRAMSTTTTTFTMR